MAVCKECKKIITDEQNFSGWCKPCFDIENNKYKRFCLRQDGIDDSLLSDSELNLIEEA